MNLWFAGEALVIVFVVRNVTSCLIPLYAYNWILRVGVADAFGEMAAIEYFIILFSVTFIIYGKRVRRWTARFGPMGGRKLCW
jgi:hypothetical protein